MGLEAPYAKSKPLAIEELELDPPGHGEVLVKIAAAGLCHSDLSVIDGNRPRPMPMALGHEAAGVVEKLGPGVDDLKRRRSCRHGVRAELRPLPAVRGRPPRAVRAGRRRQRGWHAALRPAPAASRRQRGASPSRRLGFRRVCDGVAPLAGEDRQGAAARRGGAVRMRRAHRRRRRDQHGEGAGRRSVAVVGLGGVGLELAARRGRRRRAP